MAPHSSTLAWRIPWRSLRSIEQSSLCYTTGLYQLSVLQMKKCQSLSRVQLFATPWTVARPGPLSMEFSRQEYWSGLPCRPPGDLPSPGMEPMTPVQADSLPLSHKGSHIYIYPLFFRFFLRIGHHRLLAIGHLRHHNMQIVLIMFLYTSIKGI